MTTIAVQKPDQRIPKLGNDLIARGLNTDATQFSRQEVAQKHRTSRKALLFSQPFALILLLLSLLTLLSGIAGIELTFANWNRATLLMLVTLSVMATYFRPWSRFRQPESLLFLIDLWKKLKH
jgi:hypothetical protein